MKTRQLSYSSLKKKISHKSFRLQPASLLSQSVEDVALGTGVLMERHALLLKNKGKGRLRDQAEKRLRMRTYEDIENAREEKKRSRELESYSSSSAISPILFDGLRKKKRSRSYSTKVSKRKLPEVTIPVTTVSEQYLKCV